MDAAAWDERYAGADLIWSAGPNQFVEAELSGLPPGRALDLACGEGRNGRWLAARGWEVTAIDFSPLAIEKGRRLSEQVGDGVRWVVGDALTTPLPGDLDLVVIAYLQIPGEERAVVVRRAFEALRSGGRLMLVAHDSSNLAEGTGGPQDAAVLYTAEDVLGYLDGHHFDVVRAERVAREVEAGTAWDALVHLVRS